MRLLQSALALTLLLSATFAIADPLEKDSPEVKQLEAMGYEVVPSKPGDEGTNIRLNSERLYLSQKNNALTISRTFIRAKKEMSDADKLKFFTLINQMNLDDNTQFSLTENSLVCAIFNQGKYDPKVFAELVRSMDRVDSIFTTYPDLLKFLD